MRSLRRLLIAALFLIILGLLLKGSKRYRKLVYSHYEGSIRGHPMMQPLGSVCRAGSLETIVHSRHAIVLDAGSTGTRVHIYEFQYCGEELTVLSDEVFAEIKPGLSSFAHDPKGAARSLEPLIRQALERVPSPLQSCTPLVLKATAGLRLLPQENVEAIIKEVRDYLDDHPFLLQSPHEAVSVIDGSEEAVLAWITVNFLQQQFPESNVNSSGSTVVMEMGGGSTQIVFEAPPKGPAEYYYPLEYQGKTHHLYQHSYLGYGLMEARKAIKARQTGGPEVEFACYPAGHQETLDSGVTLKGTSAGWEACLQQAKAILFLEQPCHNPPCSFAGIHQPSIYHGSEAAGWRPIVAFSYIYGRIKELQLPSLTVTLAQVAQEADRVCRLRLDRSSSSKHMNYLRHQPHWCMDLAYIYALMHHGYGIKLDHPISLVKQLHGYEAGWSLGSALRLLEHHPDTCPRIL